MNNGWPFNRLKLKPSADLFVRYDEIGEPPAPPGEAFLALEGIPPDDLYITEATDNYLAE
jgi:hypothetical protein